MTMLRMRMEMRWLSLDIEGAEYTAPSFETRMRIITTTPTEGTHRGSIMKCK